MIKEVSSKLTYKDKEYKLVFNLNVMEKIQDAYGTLDKWGELTDGANGEVNIKALVFGITEMINEAIDIDNDDNGTKDPFVTHKQVGRILTEIGIEKAAQNMNNLVVESTKDDSKNE
jgi:hypothetical protein